MSTFDDFIPRVLLAEGGYVNDPADRGGETKYGISKRSYPSVDILNLTRDAAVAIYRRDFWDAVHGEELPRGFAFQALDAAINNGVGNAIRWMQRAAGVADDGHFGPVTLAAVLRQQPCDLLLIFHAERLEFYAKLTTFNRFGAGWIRRDAQNLRFAAADN